MFIFETDIQIVGGILHFIENEFIYRCSARLLYKISRGECLLCKTKLLLCKNDNLGKVALFIERLWTFPQFLVCFVDVLQWDLRLASWIRSLLVVSETQITVNLPLNLWVSVFNFKQITVEFADFDYNS